MKEILFRGKALNCNEWVYGCFYWEYREDIRFGCVSLRDNSKRYIKETTISQYTGLKDKNGVKIFESDICVNSDKDNYPRPLSVEWIEEFACFAFVDKGDFNNMYFYQKNHMENVAVIGNIHDNKDLIK